MGQRTIHNTRESLGLINLAASVGFADFYFFACPTYKSARAVKIAHIIIKFSTGSYSGDLFPRAEAREEGGRRWDGAAVREKGNIVLARSAAAFIEPIATSTFYRGLPMQIYASREYLFHFNVLPLRRRPREISRGTSKSAHRLQRNNNPRGYKSGRKLKSVNCCDKGAQRDGRARRTIETRRYTDTGFGLTRRNTVR